MISEIKAGVIQEPGVKKRAIVQVNGTSHDNSNSLPPTKIFKHNEPYSSSQNSRLIHFTSGNPILPTNKVIRFMSGDPISFKHPRNIPHSHTISCSSTNKYTNSVTPTVLKFASGNCIIPAEKLKRIPSGIPGNPLSQANKMIKLVKPIISSGVRNETVENVYIDQGKILTALRRLKETSNRPPEDIIITKNNDSEFKMINVVDSIGNSSKDGLSAIKEDVICNDEEEIVDSETETIHVWIDKDVGSSNQVHNSLELSNPAYQQSDLKSAGESKMNMENTVELPGWYTKLAHTMTGFLELGCMVDAHLQGEDGDRVPAHQIILAHISPVLARILPEARREEESVLIMLTGVPTSFLRDFVHAVYTGVLSNNLKVMQNVFLVAQLLGVKFLGTERLHTPEYENSHPSQATAPLKQISKKNPLPVHSADQHHTSADQHHTSADQHHTPADQHHTSVDQHLISATKHHISADQHHTSADQHLILATQHHISADQHHTPADQNQTSADQHLTSTGDKNARLLETNSNMNLLLLDSKTYEISEISVDEPIDKDDLQFVKIHDNVDNQANGGESYNDENKSLSRNAKTQNLKNEMDEIVNISETTIEIVSTSTVISRKNKKIAKTKLKSLVSFEKPAVTGITIKPRVAESGNSDSHTKDTESGEYKVIYQPADRPCPICTKPRINHKNREIAVSENKGNHKGNYYKCCQCSASKLTAKKLFLHLENHISKKFQCTLCNKGYSYKNLLVEHEYKIHGEGKNERYRCPYEECKYEARYKQTLHTHITDHHKGVIKNKGSWRLRQPLVTCQRCMKVFKRQHFYSYHKKSCQVSSDGRYECSVCWKKHNSKIALNKHMQTKHPDPDNITQHLCDICDKSYSSQYSLYNHKLLKHGVNSKGERVPRKLFPCKTCGKVLTTSVKLKTHIEVIHLGIKDYNCRFCEKQFTSKSNLTIHEGTAHTGILPYSCDNCDKSFVRKPQLRQHKEQVHGIVSQPDSDKLFTSPPPDTLALNNQQQLPLVTESIQRPSIVTSDEIILHDHRFDLMPSTTGDASDPHDHDHHHHQVSIHHQQELVSQVIEDPRFNTGVSHHDDDDDDVPQLVASSADNHHHGIHDDMENSSHVIHDLENSSHVIHDMERLDDDGVLNDGHYYLVDDNDIHPVQVGDVIIPMELVEQQQSGQQQ